MSRDPNAGAGQGVARKVAFISGRRSRRNPQRRQNEIARQREIHKKSNLQNHKQGQWYRNDWQKNNAKNNLEQKLKDTGRQR